MEQLATTALPLRIVIIGAGPAGLYAAEALLTYAAPAEHIAPRRISMRFLASPVEIVNVNGQITAVKIERNELVVAPNGELVAKGTGKFERVGVPACQSHNDTGDDGRYPPGA